MCGRRFGESLDPFGEKEQQRWPQRYAAREQRRGHFIKTESGRTGGGVRRIDTGGGCNVRGQRGAGAAYEGEGVGKDGVNVGETVAARGEGAGGGVRSIDTVSYTQHRAHETR